MAGGGAGSAVGQLALQAARTRNNAGFTAGADQAARDAEANASQGILGVDIANQKAKLGQQQSALGEMGKMYGENTGVQPGLLGAANQGVNAEVNAGNSGWLQNLMGIMGTAAGGAGSILGGLNGGRSPR